MRAFVMNNRIWKRILSSALAFSMILNMCAVIPAYAEDDFLQPIEFAGKGTEAEPYILGGAEGLRALMYNMSIVPYYTVGKYFEVEYVPYISVDPDDMPKEEVTQPEVSDEYGIGPDTGIFPDHYDIDDDTTVAPTNMVRSMASGLSKMMRSITSMFATPAVSNGYGVTSDGYVVTPDSYVVGPDSGEINPDGTVNPDELHQQVSNVVIPPVSFMRAMAMNYMVAEENNTEMEPVANSAIENPDNVTYIHIPDEGDSTIVLGSSSYPESYFYGNIDFGDVVVVTNDPLFGTVSNGAVIEGGNFFVYDKTADLDEDWGGLVRKIEAVPTGFFNIISKNITIRKVTMDMVMEANGCADTASVGGLIGSVYNKEGYSLNLSIQEIKLQQGGDMGLGSTALGIATDATAVGGLIGSLQNGELLDAENAPQNPINVTVNNTGAADSFAYGGALSGAGAVGGVIGRMNLGTSLVMQGNIKLPSQNVMVGGENTTGTYVGVANQAFIGCANVFLHIQADNTSNYVQQDSHLGSADITYPVTNMGTVYDYNTLIGTALTKDGDIYTISNRDQLVLLAAAVNTMNYDMLKRIQPSLTDDYTAKETLKKELLTGTFQITGDLNLMDTGFNGIGYFQSEEHYLPFSGTITGSTTSTRYPTITLDMNSTSDNTGFIPLLAGTERAAEISNLTFKGSIETSGVGVGAVAASIGHKGMTDNKGVKISNVNSLMSITSTKVGESAVGGIIGYGDFSGITVGTVPVTLENIHVADSEIALLFPLGDNDFGETSVTGTASQITAQGSGVGGVIGTIVGMSQSNNNADFGLDMTMNQVAFEGTITANSASSTQIGGLVGKITADVTDTDSFANSGIYKPAGELGITYDNTKLDLDDVVVAGHISAKTSDLGIFASQLYGVTADFDGLVLSTDVTTYDGFAGVAQSASGYFKVNNVGYQGATVGYNGSDETAALLFGDATNAWIDMVDFTVDDSTVIDDTVAKPVEEEPTLADDTVTDDTVTDDTVTDDTVTDDTVTDDTVTDDTVTGDAVTGDAVTDDTVTDDAVVDTTPAPPVSTPVTDEIVPSDPVVNEVLPTVVEDNDGDYHVNYGEITAKNTTYDEKKYVTTNYLSGGIINFVGRTVDAPYQNQYAGITSESVNTRYYYGLDSALNNANIITGAGTAENPFVIDSVEKLQILSLLGYLSSSLSWRLLEYFPDAGYDGDFTTSNKIMFLKKAHYQFEGNLDLGDKSIYPTSIIGGIYSGVEASTTMLEDGTTVSNDATIITFHGREENQFTSPTKDHQAGLFTSITSHDQTKYIQIKNLILSGVLHGTSSTGALGSATAVDEMTSYPAADMANIYVENVKVEHLTTDRTAENNVVESGDQDTDEELSFVARHGLLFGEILSGSLLVDMLEIGDDVSADSLIGRVAKSEQLKAIIPMIQMWHVDFTDALDSNSMDAAFVDEMASGLGYYYYEMKEEEKYHFNLKADADGKLVVPNVEENSETPVKGGGEGVFFINPLAEGLTEGNGTEESPYLIKDPKQLYAVAQAILSDDQAALTTLIPNLTGPDEGEDGLSEEIVGSVFFIKEGNLLCSADEAGDFTAEIIDHLSSAYYRLKSNIDMNAFLLSEEESDVQSALASGYVGIGTYDHPFTGNFAGDGYEINLRDHGLFGVVDGMTISNIVLKSDSGNTVVGENELRDVINISNKTTADEAEDWGANADYYGGIADVVLGGDNFVSNVDVEVQFNVQTGANPVYVGGFVGHLEAGTLVIANQMDGFADQFNIYEDNTLVTNGNVNAGIYYAGIAPSVHDGYIIYEGDNVDDNITITGNNLPNAQVNHEYEATDGGAVYVASNSAGWSYSLRTSEGTTGLPDGMTMDPNGKITGTPIEGGIYTFDVVATKNSDVEDGEVGFDKDVYDYGTYTLVVNPDNLPAIQLSDDSKTSFTRFRYGAQQTIEVVNPFYTDGPADNMASYTQLNNMQYQVVQGANNVKVTKLADGSLHVEGVGVGAVVINLWYPADNNYDASEVYRLSFSVLASDLVFEVQGASFRQGIAKLPEGTGNLYLSGADALAEAYDPSIIGEDGRILLKTLDGTIDANVQAFMNAYGISIPQLLIPTEISSYSKDTEAGSYTILVQPITLDESSPVLGQYDIGYSHGVVQIEYRNVVSGDYEIQTQNGNLAVFSPMGWYNEPIQVVPAGEYDKISTDGVNWKEALYYNQDAKGQITIYLWDEDEDAVSERAVIDLKIDMIAPTVSPEHVGDVCFDKAPNGENITLEQWVFGGIYRDNFKLQHTFGDVDDDGTTAKASGVNYSEYLWVPLGTSVSMDNADGFTWEKIARGDSLTIDKITHTSGVLYLRTVDFAENYSAPTPYIYSDLTAAPGSFLIDGEAPTIAMTNEDKQNVWYQYAEGFGAIDLTVTEQGDAGISQISYEVTYAATENGEETQISFPNEDGTSSTTCVAFDDGVRDSLEHIAVADKTVTVDLQALFVNNVDENGKLPNGIYTLDIKVRDHAGNVTTKEAIYMKDDTVPSASLVVDSDFATINEANNGQCDANGDYDTNDIQWHKTEDLTITVEMDSYDTIQSLSGIKGITLQHL